jgi:hypothetical protein
VISVLKFESHLDKENSINILAQIRYGNVLMPFSFSISGPELLLL